MLNDLGDDLIDQFSRLKLLAAAIGHASLACTLQNIAKGGSRVCDRDEMFPLTTRV